MDVYQFSVSHDFLNTVLLSSGKETSGGVLDKSTQSSLMKVKKSTKKICKKLVKNSNPKSTLDGTIG